ncbi:MAG: response regulator [Ignavibacteriales bacterium]|nr:response regulator [Ignavibacteriales bacterium]
MKLFIADTNDRVRQRLASIAASVEGLAVAGEAGDVGNAVEGIKRAKPDSVIVALPLSGGSGLDVLSAAKSMNPASVAIMLTQSPCSECQQKCFAMGADYFFEKSGEMKKIVTTLVLLAHQLPQQKPRVEHETTTRILHSLLNPSDQSLSVPLGVLVVCPRIASPLAPKSTVCFLAGGG